MKKLPVDTPNQLELRLLVDLNGRAGEARVTVVQADGLQLDQPDEQAASERDRTVYRMIASDYFSSLRRAEGT